jgi:PIN domain nuclease of toxin-antitoxin system
VTALVLDTHAALWWSFFPEKLSHTAAKVLEEAETLVFPAIVFWETALLVRKRRLELELTPAAWLRGLRSSSRARIVSLTAEVALRADRLAMHDDPADRFIVATAMRAGAPLVTRDAAIRSAKLVPTIW